MPVLSARWTRLAGRWLLSGTLIALVFWAVDGESLWRELGRVSPFVLLPALILTVIQITVSAWRWRYTAERLGLRLPYGVAVREYYLGTFLNQILPGGVLGDVNRAWRHGTSASDVNSRVTALHGVAIERLSGQLMLALVVAMSVGWLVQSGRLVLWSLGIGVWVVLGFFVLALALWLAFRFGLAGYLQRLRRDIFESLLRWPALPVQLGSSLLVLASYLGVFLFLAVGAGYLESVEAALVIAALATILLLSMVIPLTVAGWGIRESAAAILWPLAGLPAEQGVALSVGYGGLVFGSSLPGLAFVFTGKLRLA